MNKNIRLILGLLALLVFQWSCQKDDLFVEDLAPLKGEFNWVYNFYTTLFLFEYSYHTRDATEDDFTASISFEEPNKITFFINGEEYVEKSFKVLEQETRDGKLFFEIKVDVNSKDLDISDNLELVYWNDTLQIDEFPHDGYSGEKWGKNYFIRE